MFVFFILLGRVTLTHRVRELPDPSSTTSTRNVVTVVGTGGYFGRPVKGDPERDGRISGPKDGKMFKY